MQSYNYRSAKAMAEYRYPQINQNPSYRDRVAPSKIGRDEWHAAIPDGPGPARRKRRSNNRAPDNSRAA